MLFKIVFWNFLLHICFICVVRRLILWIPFLMELLIMALIFSYWSESQWVLWWDLEKLVCSMTYLKIWNIKKYEQAHVGSTERANCIVYHIWYDTQVHHMTYYRLICVSLVNGIMILKFETSRIMKKHMLDQLKRQIV